VYKLAERLTENYLMKLIGEMVFEICKKEFDGVFKQVCERENSKNTTIGECYSILENMANQAVASKMDSLSDEVTSEMNIVKCSPEKNPFALIAYDLWKEFLDYYSVKGYVEMFIADECNDKQALLIGQGILDEHGDFIKK
jgi:hypothetical protein